jgi:hypothetical protein
MTRLTVVSHVGPDLIRAKAFPSGGTKGSQAPDQVRGDEGCLARSHVVGRTGAPPGAKVLLESAPYDQAVGPKVTRFHTPFCVTATRRL